MNYVTAVSFSILINGQPTDQFVPHIGLKQGDPLSPYLFILCAEVLSGLTAKGQDRGRLHEIKIAQITPPISHLLFSDDNLFFCQASPDEA